MELHDLALYSGRFNDYPYAKEALADFKEVTLNSDEASELRTLYDVLLDEILFKRAAFAAYSM